MKDFKHTDLTGQIIGASHTVHNELGHGFLEKVYQNALMIELRDLGLIVEKESPIKVKYKGHIVGDYFADLLVENKLIVEIKAVKQLTEVHEVQLVNYLKATGIEVGLLINFSKSVEVRRRVFENINNNKSA